jgi:uncharacterized protein (TIGR02145 family)
LLALILESVHSQTIYCNQVIIKIHIITKAMIKNFPVRNLLLVFTHLLLLPGASAQFYYINFEGTGAATFVDSVKVLNNTQQTSLVMNGSDTLFLFGTVGNTEPVTSMESELALFPNPAGNTSYFKFPVSEPGDHVISVYNLSGEPIASSKVMLGKGFHEFEISGLGTGLYNLQVVCVNMKHSSKLVITGTTNYNPAIRKIAFNQTYQEAIFKSGRGVVEMQYNTDDLLLITCYADIYAVVIPLVAIKSETIIAQFVPCTDGDGNHYPVVYIGSQIWMARNLATTKYSDGSDIPNITVGSTWSNLTTGAYVWYGNNVSNKQIYGGLYNWYATNPATNGNKQLCPEGWRVASDADFTALTSFLGATTTAGGKLKETGFTHWNSPNTGASNEKGFTALPGGWRGWNANFQDMGTYCWFWTQTEQVGNFAWLRNMFHNAANMGRGTVNKSHGLAIRCIKD